VGNIDYPELRRRMVQTQLIPRGIGDERVLEAMEKVPRHLFVGEDVRFAAYDDSALQIGEGQTISQPYMVAIMSQLLELRGIEKVLEIGTGSGYQTAVLAELSGEVFSIERLAGLSSRAGERLAALGYDNVTLRTGDGTLGWPEEAPFERILITAGTPDIPETVPGQLGDGGIIVAPVGSMFSQQLVKTRRSGRKFKSERHTPCVFVPLVGEHGWGSSGPA
jgi:protein-L-isoaspartate(D-aspartate) O-methyltransferase